MKWLEKTKQLLGDNVELFGVDFRNKGEDLRAQAFVLKVLFIFNVVIMPFSVFDSVRWITFIVDHAYVFNIIIILFGNPLYYLYDKFIAKDRYHEHESYKHEKKDLK